MTTIDEQPTLEASRGPTDPAQPTPYQPCDSCGSPVDERQRYCVVCGTRRRHANDPAARFLSEATKRRRAGASPAAASGTPRIRRSASLATAVVIAMIPAALGAGVLIGRSSGGGDANLIAALKAQKAPVIQYSPSAPASGSGGSGGTQAASAAVAAPVSTFKGASGYAVALGTLPAGTTQTAAEKAQRSDRAKGATAVGLIALSQYSVKPEPSSGAYVIYSGDYSTAQAAQARLRKLKRSFPHATVIAIKSLSASSATAGKVLTKTHYGTAHQVTSYKPSSSALKQGASVAAKDSHSTGKTASGVGLPDVVAVP